MASKITFAKRLSKTIETRDPFLYPKWMMIGLSILIACLLFWIANEERMIHRIEEMYTIKNNRAADFRLASQPMIGRGDAPITMVIAFDVESPTSRLFYEKHFQTMKTHWIDRGLVKMYWMNYPFLSEDSKRVATALELIYAIKPDSFFSCLDAIFEQAKHPLSTWSHNEFFLMMAKKSGLSERQLVEFARQLNNEDPDLVLKTDLMIASHEQIDRSPSIWIDGVLFKDGLDQLDETLISQFGKQ